MKKLHLFFSLVLICGFTCFLPQSVYANMAAPDDPDIGSSITFAKNNAIAVRSEVLDINVDGPEAYITAIYHMENTTGEHVSTPAMFLAPNMDCGSVTVDGTGIPFTARSYDLSYGTEVATEDWQYAVLTSPDLYSDRTVDTVTFTLDFTPGESHNVSVSYAYRLGGYPNLGGNYSAYRSGEINYYLAPAAMWKDFKNLTINLHLDENLPRITASNFAFEKVDRLTYQCVCNTLPAQNLKITLEPDRLSSFSGEIWSYMMFFPILFPILILLLVVLLAVILVCIPKRK